MIGRNAQERKWDGCSEKEAHLRRHRSVSQSVSQQTLCKILFLPLPGSDVNLDVYRVCWIGECMVESCTLLQLSDGASGCYNFQACSAATSTGTLAHGGNATTAVKNECATSRSKRHAIFKWQ